MADITASLAALSASLQDNGLGATLSPLTGIGAGGSQGPVGVIEGVEEQLTGSFSSTGNADGTFLVALLPLTGSFSTTNVLAATLSLGSASFSGDPGVTGVVLATMLAPTSSLAGDPLQLNSLAGALSAPTSSLSGFIVAAGPVAARLARAIGSFQGQLGSVGSIAALLEQLSSSASGSSTLSGSIAIALPRSMAYFSGDQNLAAVLDAWAMNTRNNAVSKYPGYPANSYARYNRTYLAAGPNGILNLAGDPNVDFDSAGISWVIRTGQTDDKKSALKRITEVLLGVRYDGPVRMRIWKDENTYFDYILPNLSEDVLQQVRAKPGKGLRSRYYKIELSGVGTRFELDSLQATMPETTRRIG